MEEHLLNYRITQSRLLYVMTISDLNHIGMVKVGEVIVDNDVADDGDLDHLKEAVTKSLMERKYMQGEPAFNLELVECTTFMSDALKCYKAQDVHDVLIDSGVDCVRLHGEHDIWFLTDTDTVKRAIQAVKEDKKTFNGTDDKVKPRKIKFRPEQKNAIDETVHSFGLVKKENHSYLWDAKMRFGKTLSGLEVARQMDYETTLIVTHRPVVDSGWYDDFLKIFGDDKRYIYGSRMKYREETDGNTPQCMRNVEMDGFNMLTSAVAMGKSRLIFFVSMQYLRLSTMVGGKDKDPLKRAIMKYDWQLVMIDEAHEGTESTMGKRVIEKLTKDNTRILSLSGTPFNLLDKFDNSRIYTWDYVMEQKAKQSWDDENYGDPNPYADLPRMKILTFTMSDMLRGQVGDMPGSFSFHDFFRVWTGKIADDKRKMPSQDLKGKFIYEEQVKLWLDRLVESSEDSHYPFSNEEFQDKFRHTFWLLPGVKEAKALEELLHNHFVFNDSNFKIVNVAGDGNIEDKDGKALKAVQKAIRENDRTITLSCGKLTTGVTIPEWTAVLCLKGSENTPAANYMQTIFRVQNHATLAGKMKSDCYVFDFAPDRALTAVAETAKMQVIAAGGKNSAQLKLTQIEEEEQLTAFLQLCPVISMDGARMGHHFSANKLFEKLKNVYVERAVRSGYADNSIYNVDELMNLNDEQKEILKDVHDLLGSMPNLWKPSKIDVATNGMSQQEKDKARSGDKKDREGKPKTPEEIEAQKKRDEENKEKQARISVMRGIAIRIPLLVYGADIDDEKEELTIDNITDDKIVDDASWDEFMPKGITKEVFKVLAPLFDRAIFTGAAKRIRDMVKAADVLTIEERIAQIARIFSFFHNPDKETVLTPWRVVNRHLSDTIGGWCFYNEKFDGYYTETNEYEEEVPAVRYVDHGDVSTNIFSDYNTRVLEINSKTGLYPLYMAYSIFKTRKEPEFRKAELTEERNKKGGNYDKQAKDDQVIWDEVLMENIFVVCRTRMAVSITNQTLRGSRKDVHTNVKCYEKKVNISDLVNANILKQNNEFSARGETQKVCDMIEVLRAKPKFFIEDVVQGRQFWHVSNSITMKPQEDINNIKFSVIVGNPPYQLVDGGGGSSSIPLYNEFVIAAKSLSPTYISMIMPARWFSGGKGLDDFRAMMIEDKCISVLHDYVDSHDCFPRVQIEGGICYFLRDSNHNDMCDIYTHMKDDEIKLSHRYLAVDDVDIFIRHEEVINIIQKVTSHPTFKPFSDVVFARNLFGIPSDVPSEYITDFALESKYQIFGRFNNNREWRLLKNDFQMSRSGEEIDRMVKSRKLFVSKADGAAGQIGNPIPARIIGKAEMAKPNTVCTETFLVVGPFNTDKELKSAYEYMQTKFFRFCVGVRKNKNMTRDTYQYAPLLDFNKVWSDETLYELFNLNEDEINYIETMIAPID